MNSHLSLQYGLHDVAVSNSPYAFWWIHWLPENTQVLSCFCQVRHSHNFSKFYRAGATDVSNFLRAFLMVSLNSVSSGSMKWIPLNFLAFSIWSFSSDHFCFSFSLACFPIDFHNSGHRWSGLDVSCFLVNLHPDQVYPSGAFSSSRVNCVNPVQGSDKSREPSMFQ